MTKNGLYAICKMCNTEFHNDTINITLPPLMITCRSCCKEALEHNMYDNSTIAYYTKKGMYAKLKALKAERSRERKKIIKENEVWAMYELARRELKNNQTYHRMYIKEKNSIKDDKMCQWRLF